MQEHVSLPGRERATHTACRSGLGLRHSARPHLLWQAPAAHVSVRFRGLGLCVDGTRVIGPRQVTLFAQRKLRAARVRCACLRVAHVMAFAAVLESCKLVCAKHAYLQLRDRLDAAAKSAGCRAGATLPEALAHEPSDHMALRLALGCDAPLSQTRPTRRLFDGTALPLRRRLLTSGGGACAVPACARPIDSTFN